ncbi:MAG: rhodanese-like domain-containing protein [Phycisphaerales bacterium]
MCVASKAVIVTVIASAIGMADVFVVRKKNLEIAAPKASPVVNTPAGAANPGEADPTTPAAPAAKPKSGASAPGAARPAAGGPRPVAPPALDPNMITLAQTIELFGRMMTAGDVRFVDARNPEDFVKGRIPAAVCLPPTKFGGTIPPEVDMLSRDATIVIYCGGGDCDASKLTALRLNELGFGTTLIFHEGFPAWEKAGQPVEK